MIKRAGNSKPIGKSRFKYHERTVEDVKKRAEQTGGRFDSIFKQGFGVFRAKVGENVVRILPPTWDEHEHYGLDIWVHSRIGQDNSDYLCLRKMNGEHCSICDAADAAREGGDNDESKALQANQKVVMWIIDRDGDQPTPILWLASWSADRDIAALCHDRRKGKVWLLDHPDDGYDLIIRRTGQGLMTRYTYQLDREASPILSNSKAQDEVLDYITDNPVPTSLLFRDDAYLGKVLAGAVVEADEDLDEEKPARGRRARDEDEEDEKPVRSRRKRDEEDAEDEKPSRRVRARDEEDDEEKPARSRRARDDDDEEDEKPARSRRARDDDDEEEKPARRARGRDEEDAEDEKPARTRRARDEDEDEKPARTTRRARDDEEDDEDEKPARSRRARDEDEDERPARSTRRARDEDDDRRTSRR